MSVPAIVITLALEEPVRVSVDVLHEGECVRLCDWIDSHPALRGLLDAAHTLQGRAAA